MKRIIKSETNPEKIEDNLDVPLTREEKEALIRKLQKSLELKETTETESADVKEQRLVQFCEKVKELLKSEQYSGNARTAFDFLGALSSRIDLILSSILGDSSLNNENKRTFRLHFLPRMKLFGIEFSYEVREFFGLDPEDNENFVEFYFESDNITYAYAE